MSFVNSKDLPAPRAVHGISEQQRCDIVHFLQGSVYCWCKNRKGEPFAARDLLGGDNYYWHATPMMALYEYYLNGNDENHDFSISDYGIYELLDIYVEVYNEHLKGYMDLYEVPGSAA